MVKKIFFTTLTAGFILAVLVVGCNKNNNPVIPADSAVLQLVIPSKILNAVPKAAKLAKITSHKDAVPDSSQGLLEYCLVADGQAPVTGQISYASGSEVGTVTIPLPKAGTWVVSTEWFYLYYYVDNVVKNRTKVIVPPGYTAYPEFVGADKVDVQGTTTITLNMEDIGYSEYNCYYDGDITDPTNVDYGLGGVSWFDLYSFDSGIQSASVSLGATGDVEASYDTTTASTYFTGPYPVTVSQPSNYTYLGNGDLVNFPVVPSNAVFYPNTLQAKAAVVGQAASTIIGDDIFAVKVPSTGGMAWVQFGAPNISGGPNNSSFNTFTFVYNKEGLNYMKFDQTSNGLANCNQNTVVP
jgi:hypothetical protein